MRNVEESVFQFMNIRWMSSPRTSVWEEKQNSSGKILARHEVI